MTVVRGLARRYVGRAALLVIMVTGSTGLEADAPAARPSPGAPSPATVRGPGAGALGSAKARIAIVEFSDYQCPFCRRYYRDSFPALKARYVDTGKARYVVRELPLDIHSEAFAAAEAARCAGAAGKFWPMREALFAAASLERSRLVSLARGVGVPEAAFQACLDQHRYAAEIKADMAEARAAGLSATPSFVIGTISPRGITGTRVVGAQRYPMFARLLDDLQGAR